MKNEKNLILDNADSYKLSDKNTISIIPLPKRRKLMKNSLLWNMKHYFVLLPMFLIPLFFSFIGFVDGNERSQPSRYRNVEVESGGSAEDDDAVQERARYRKFVEIKAGGSAEKALIKYNEWMKKHASLAAKSFDQLSDIEKAK